MKRVLSQEQLGQEKRGGVQVFVRLKPTQDGDQSIFSGDDENGRSVVATKTPQRSRQIQYSYKNDRSLEKLNEIFQDKADVFFFDNVFSQKSSQEIFYRKTAKEAVSNIVSGQNTSILIHGPSRCGKTYTLTGADKHQKGLMFRCVDDLLSKIDVANEQDSQYKLFLSIFSVYNNEIFDLLSNENSDYYEVIEYSPNDVRIAGMSRHLIKYKSEFKNKYVNALKKIQSLSQLLNEKKLYEKSHIVVQFNVSESEQINFKLNLVRLADIDLVDKQINGDDFEVIEQYINQINQNTSQQTRAYKKCKLTQCIRDTINENTQSFFISCVSSSSNQYAQSLLSLDYTQRLCAKGSRHHEGNEIRSSFTSNSQKRLLPSRPPVSPNSVKSSLVENVLRPQLSQSNLRQSNVINQSSTVPKSNIQTSHIEFIVNELENIFEDIRKQSRVFGRLPERERNEWVGQKEVILNDLQRQIESQPYSRDIPYCETLLIKCQRQLRLINPSLSDQRQISGSPPQGHVNNLGHGGKLNGSQTNFFQGNLNNSFSRVNQHNRKQSQGGYAEQVGRLSPSQENRYNDYEFLKDKEEKLDKDFMRLLDRYNHSKELIDSLSNPQGQQHSQLNQPYPQQLQRVQTQPSLGQRSPIQSIVRNSQILQSPQQRLADISNVHQQHQNNQEMYRSQDSSGFLDQPPINKSKVAVSSNIGELSPNFDLLNAEEKEKNVGKSLKRLKETIEIKENIEKSKIQKLRQLNKDLKQSLREYVEKYEQLSDILNSKDGEIDRLQYELRQAQEDILLNVDTVKEFKIKEQGWLLMEEELRESNIQLKSKLLKKKKKANQIKEEFRRKEEELLFQKKSHDHEIEKYKRTVQEHEEIKSVDQNKATALSEIVNQLKNDMEQREQEQKQVFQNLQEMRQLNQELNQKYQNEVIEKNETVNQTHALTRKKEELEEQIQILEQKIQKHKQKFEDEKSKLIEERNQENLKKKEKIKFLKAQLADNEDKHQELEGKYQLLIKQADNLEAQLRETQKYLNELKEIKDEQTYKIAKLTEEKNNSYLENERLQNLVSSLEGRVEKLEASQLGDAKTINEIKEQSSRLQSELNEKEDQLSKANQHIDQLQEQQNIELSTFEIRLDQVVQEFTACKEENNDFKRKEIDSKKLLQNLEEQVEKYKEKYLKAKHSNKNLQSHLKELENRVKDYMTERSIEVQTQARERERQSKVEQTQKNKLRILDEIQQMIKSHKQNSTIQKYEN
ncbi:hypothetical protein ABPG72_006293 [Tetrahymena utriculariae]